MRNRERGMAEFGVLTDNHSSSDSVEYIKQEVDVPEGDEYENEGCDELGNIADPGFMCQTHESDSDPDWTEENCTDARQRRRTFAPRVHERKKLASGGLTHKEMAWPSKSIDSVVITSKNQDEEDDSSDGEVPEPRVTMTRILHDAKFTFGQVERWRHCIIVLEILPKGITCRGPGTIFYRDELRAMIKSYRPKPVGGPAKEGTSDLRPPGPKSRTGASAANRKGPTTCEKCGKKFTRPAALVYHMQHSHIETEADAKKEWESRKHQCQTCGKRFPRIQRLKSHMQTHTGIGLHPCRICGKRYFGNTHRDKHEKNCAAATVQPAVIVEGQNGAEVVVPVPTPALDTYGIVIKGDKVSLRRPVGMTNAKPNPFLVALNQGIRRKVCRYCQKIFPSFHQCRVHEFRHTGTKPYKCTNENCTAAFFMAIRLAEHVRTVHTGEKPFKCQYEGCGEAYAKTTQFKSHILKVHLQTKYPCSTCGKTFTTRGVLKLHMQKHSGIKPYLCADCGKSFVWEYGLKQHARVHLHPPYIPKRKPERKYDEFGNKIVKPRPFHCPQEGCTRTFIRRINMYKHLKMTHGITSDILRNHKPRKKKRELKGSTDTVQVQSPTPTFAVVDNSSNSLLSAPDQQPLYNQFQSQPAIGASHSESFHQRQHGQPISQPWSSLI